MSTFDILLECLPFLGFVGFGLYFILTVLVPSWREMGWRHWKRYKGYSANDQNSWLVSLGFVKADKPLAEGDFDEKTAIWLYSALGGALLIIGIAGIIWIAYLNPGK